MKATARVHVHVGHARNPSTYALDTAKDVLHEGMEPVTDAYPHHISGRHIRQIPGVQEQPISSTRQNTSSYHQINHHCSEPDRADVSERSALPPPPGAAMEPWSAEAFGY